MNTQNTVLCVRVMPEKDPEGRPLAPETRATDSSAYRQTLPVWSRQQTVDRYSK